MLTDAVIIRTQPVRESDLFVHAFTQNAGRLWAVARGALAHGSVQGMHLDQGNVVRFGLVQGKGIPIITGAHALETFPLMRSELPRQAAAWVFLESLDILVAGTERDERLWQAISGTLRELAICPAVGLLPVLRNRQRELLGILGYAPRVSECGVCGGPPAGGPDGKAVFSRNLGSVVCGACHRAGWKGSVLAAGDLTWLAGRADEAVCARLAGRAPTEELLEYIAGRPLRSLDLLFSVHRA